MKLQGIFVDNTTPFDHAGELYRVKIEHNIGKWNQTSVTGYVVGGVTGEGALLTSEEKTELWKLAAAAAGPGKLLIAGVELPGVHAAVEQINHAAGLGFAAALLETSHRGERQLLYLRSVADRAPIPVLISARPDFSAEALRTISQHPNVAGVVDHSGGIKPGATTLLCGLETSLWSSLTDGASGAALSFANAAPYAVIALWEAFRTREEEAGLDWQSRITPAAQLIERCGIAGLKHAMDLNGFYGGPPRLPWLVPGAADRLEIERAFADLKG